MEGEFLVCYFCANDFKNMQAYGTGWVKGFSMLWWLHQEAKKKILKPEENVYRRETLKNVRLCWNFYKRGEELPDNKNYNCVE